MDSSPLLPDPPEVVDQLFPPEIATELLNKNAAPSMSSSATLSMSRNVILSTVSSAPQ